MIFYHSITPQDSVSTVWVSINSYINSLNHIVNQNLKLS